MTLDDPFYRLYGIRDSHVYGLLHREGEPFLVLQWPIGPWVQTQMQCRCI